MVFFFLSFLRSSKLVARALNPYTAPTHIADVLDFAVGGNHFPLYNKPLGLHKPSEDHKLGRAISLGPRLIRLRYNVSASNIGRHPDNRQAVVEFQEQFFSQDDLDSFFLEIVGGNYNSSVAKIVS